MSNEKQNPDCPRCALGDGSASEAVANRIAANLPVKLEDAAALLHENQVLRQKLAKLDNFVAWMRGRTHELDRYNAHTTLSMFIRKLDAFPNNRGQTMARETPTQGEPS